MIFMSTFQFSCFTCFWQISSTGTSTLVPQFRIDLSFTLPMYSFLTCFVNIFFFFKVHFWKKCSVSEVPLFVCGCPPSQCVHDELSEILLQRVCSAETKTIKFYSTKHLSGAETPQPSVARGSLLHNYDRDGFSSIWF